MAAGTTLWGNARASVSACRIEREKPQSICLFFFQAEDGIRARDVTGVQTCALPILDATVSAHNVSEKSKRDTVGKHRGAVARLLHRAGERLRQTEHDQIAGTKIRRVKSFYPANSGFIGHLIKRNLRDAKANRIERDIQTNDWMVTEVNQLCIAETPIGHFSGPS